MNILVLHGSMRKGHTHALTQAIVSRLSTKPEVEIEAIGVDELDLPFCISCHLCFKKGEEHCPHYDQLRRVTAALHACDGLIISGTTYMWALNAAMKNLLDHHAWLFHRPALFGKHGIVVATSAGAGEKNVTRYLRSVLGQWGINKAQVVTLNTKEQKMGGGGDGLPAKKAANIDNVVEVFYQRIKSGKQLSPALKSIAVHNAFRAMSLSDYSESERDTAHWQKPGFVDKSYPAKAGLCQRIVGAIVFGAASRATAMLGKRYVGKNT